MANNYLHNWLFSYCSLQNLWLATTRDNQTKMFNHYNSSFILKAPTIFLLTQIIKKNKGQLPATLIKKQPNENY